MQNQISNNSPIACIHYVLIKKNVTVSSTNAFSGNSIMTIGLQRKFLKRLANNYINWEILMRSYWKDRANFLEIPQIVLIRDKIQRKIWEVLMMEPYQIKLLKILIFIVETHKGYMPAYWRRPLKQIKLYLGSRMRSSMPFQSCLK